MRLAVCILLALCLVDTHAADLSVDGQPQDQLLGERLREAARLEVDGDASAAQQLLLEAVEMITASAGDYSRDLINPLVSLGRLNMAAGDLEAAEEYLRRAQHIIHRNEGVTALRQLDVISLMAQVHLQRDAPFDADREQQMVVYLSERNYGTGSTQILPALYELAEWYADTGQFYRARKTLERAIRIVEATAGENDPRLVRPLIESAKVRRMQRVCCSYKFLERARTITANNADVTNDERAKVLTALGDAYLASGKNEAAREAYDAAWQLIGTEAARDRFAEPAQIAMAKELGQAERDRARIFEVDSSRFAISAMRELSPEEVLRIESKPPQSFIVPLGDGGPAFHLADAHSQDQRGDQQRRVIGHPFQFDYKQLQNVLPLRWQKEDKLAQLSVQLDFTVNPDGKVSDIEVLGNPPHRVARLMREVLYKTRFRPRIVDGEPVTTENYLLTQTFDR